MVVRWDIITMLWLVGYTFAISLDGQLFWLMRCSCSPDPRGYVKRSLVKDALENYKPTYCEKSIGRLDHFCEYCR